MKYPVDEKCKYSLGHYRHILRKAKKTHRIPLVRDVAFGVPDYDFFVIRHDIDITPHAAEIMAEVEQEEGVCTSYYFRLHAPFYNMFDASAVETALRIAEMGHEIGLHYEPGFFLDRGLDPIEGIQRDIAMFEDLVGMRTHTICQHQPTQGPLLGEISPDHPCAYQREMVVDMPYYGDSGFHWREGCICTKLHQPQVHTLIHPHSWTISDRSWQDVLRAHAAQLNGDLSKEMEAYIVEVEAYLANRARLDKERAERYR